MKINENQKVTLTLGQLKRLVNESTKGSKIIHRCDSTTYRHIYAVPNYKDHEVVLFGVDTKEALEELLVSEFSVDETHASDLADKLWNLKPQSSGSYFSRIV